MQKISVALVTVLFVLTQVPVFGQGESQLTIKEYIERALPPQEGRKVVYNEQAKLLTITDTKGNHRLIKQLIQQFEVGQKQVIIETRFVEIDITDLRELGIEWDFFKKGSGPFKAGETDRDSYKFFDRVEIGSDAGTTPLKVNPEYQGIHWNDSTDVTFPKTGDLAGQFLIYKLYEWGDFITANLRALEQQGKANLLSAPKVTTVSGQMANIQVARTYPYVSDFTLENIGTAEFPIWTYKLTISEKSVGISLEVTPYVSENSKTITLDLHPEVSVLVDQIPISNLQTTGQTAGVGVVIIPDELGWPVVDIRTTQTSIAIDSGETIVLGGMMKDDERVTKRKVPLLGDIPFLGKAFQYDYRNQRKINLLIFITASIIDADGEAIR